MFPPEVKVRGRGSRSAVSRDEPVFGQLWTRGIGRETMELLKFKFSPFSSLFYFYFPGRDSSWEKFLSCREKEEDFSFFAHVNK